MTLANGSAGSVEYSREETIDIRAEESRLAASTIGAKYIPSIVDDLSIFYEPSLIARLAWCIRQLVVFSYDFSINSTTTLSLV